MGWRDAPIVSTSANEPRWKSAPVVNGGKLALASEGASGKVSNSIGRQLGLGSRAVAEGIGNALSPIYDAAGAVTNLGIAGLNGLGADLPYVRSGSENVSGLADAAGLPTPQTGSERFASTVVRDMSSVVPFLGLGGALAQSGNRVAAGVGNALTSNVPTQLTGAAAGGTLASMTDNPALKIAGEVMGNLGAPGISAARKSLMRRGEAGRANVERAVQDFGSFGATPTVAQATGRPVWGALESLLGRAPGAVSRMRTAVSRIADAAGAKLRAMGQGVTEADAGRTMKRGIEGFVDRFKTKAGELYDAVDRFIPGNTTVGVSNTQAALARLSNPVPGAPSVGSVLANPKIAAIAEAVSASTGNAGGLPYDALKALRTNVGEMLGGSELISGAPRAQVKHLYSALSDDMSAAAAAAGPDAERAFARANQYYKSGLGRIDGTLDRLSKIADPERLTEALRRGDTTTLLAARRSVTPDEWADVARAQVQNLGRARSGQQNAAGDAFSLETFLTNWDAMGKDAQDAMFAGIRGAPTMANDLRAIARAAGDVRKASRILANPSGTAGATAGLGAGGFFLYSLMTGQPKIAAGIAGGAGAANLMARWMTSPKTVKWLAEATRAPVERIPSLLARLSDLAKDDPEIREPVALFIENFRPTPTLQ